MSQQESLALIRQYYDRKTGLIPQGAGLVWFMSQDQLHPPMINNSKYWMSPDGWKLGAEQTVRNLLQMINPKKGETILDIGCGIGGPGRLVNREFHAKMIELNLGMTQLKTNQSLSSPLINSRYQSIDHLQADGQRLPFANETINHCMSVNMFYHFEDPSWVTNELHRVLKSKGRVGIDDWFLTNKTNMETVERLRYEWSSPAGFHNYARVKSYFRQAGFHIAKEVDMTKSGINYINEGSFGITFDKYIRPIILENFSNIYQYPSYAPEHASQAADQLKNAVLLMGDLYRNGEATYNQIVFEKD